MEEDPRKFLIELRELCRVSPSKAIEKIDGLLTEIDGVDAGVDAVMVRALDHEIKPE